MIVEIDGQDVTALQDVADVVAGHKPGDRITITVERDGRRRSFDVTLRGKVTTGSAGRARPGASPDGANVV